MKPYSLPGRGRRPCEKRPSDVTLSGRKVESPQHSHARLLLPKWIRNELDLFGWEASHQKVAEHRMVTISGLLMSLFAVTVLLLASLSLVTTSPVQAAPHQHAASTSAEIMDSAFDGVFADFLQVVSVLFRITVTWVVSFLCAWLIRTFVPPDYGMVMMGKVGCGFAFNRVGFWLCIVTAIALVCDPS